jgi:hypothetical protein
MSSSPRPDSQPTRSPGKTAEPFFSTNDQGHEAPGVPGFKTWRGVYLLVFGWFVFVVILLTIFSRLFA